MAKNKKSAAATPAAPAEQSARRFQRFERAVTKRSALSFPENNPRNIDKHAFKKLKEGLKTYGLLNSLVINRRREANGFSADQEGQLIIIGGNQRARAMDDISGYPDKENSDYEVPIDLLEVGPGKEREIIVVLNNQSLQGSWDYDLLAELLASPEVEVKNVGFDRAELAMMFDEGVLDSLLGETSTRQSAAETPVVEMLEAYNEAGREAVRDARAAASTENVDAASTPGDDTSTPDPEAPAAKADPNSREAMIERRHAYQEKSRDANEANYMAVLVADTDAELAAFLHKLQLSGEPSNCIPLRKFLDRMSDYTTDHAIADLLPADV
jgi:hypothetical protein